MAKNFNNKEQQSPQQILKRIQQQSSEQKRLQTQKILHREETNKPIIYGWWQKTYAKFKTGYNQRKKELIKMSRVSQNRHIAIMTVFFLGALIVSWKIEDKYDKIRARADNTKGIKTRQIEIENAYINKMLKKNPFQPVPIEQEQKQQQSYIYEQAQIEFDTKADMMEVMQQERRIFDNEDEQQ